MPDHRPLELSPRCDIDAENFQRISDDLARIAATLSKLSTEPAPASMKADQKHRKILSNIVLSVIRARRLRNRYFAEGLFVDPAWDTLLDLYHAELCGKQVSVSDVAVGAGLPLTTALRWLNAMSEKGLCTRHADPLDARRALVELTPTASQALWQYFSQVGRAARSREASEATAVAAATTSNL